jgi:hypothetical protein
VSLRPAQSPLAFALLASLASFAAGCGYRPLYSTASADPEGPFAVVSSPARVASAIAIAAAEAGARTELARAGQLASCSPDSDKGCASMIIEILRVEETSEGIALEAAPSGAPERPVARGVRLTITGRARIRASNAAEGAFLRDTGDVLATEVISSEPGAPQSVARFSIHRDEAVRLAAKTLGERLARRLLGVPDPGDDNDE